jgi:hypothetical protein
MIGPQITSQGFAERSERYPMIGWKIIWMIPRKVLKKPACAIVIPSLEMIVGMNVGKKDAYRSLKKCPVESKESLKPELSGRSRLNVFDDIKQTHSL